MKYLAEMFPDQRPLFVAVAEEHGYGEILDRLVEKAFAQGEVIGDLRVVQAILLVASMRCNSMYCSVFHSLILNTLGVEPNEIEYIVTHHRFPPSLEEFRCFDEFLTHAFFRKSVYVNDDYSYVGHGHLKNGAPARRDLLTILLLSDLLLMLTVAFDDEVNLELETFFETFPTHDRVADYIQFFSRQHSEHQDGTVPTFTLCMHCKRIQNQKTDQWQPIEVMIGVLPKSSQFSHGICVVCVEQYEEQLAALAVR